jgi:hypothetical protein
MFCIFSGLNLVCDEMCSSDASYIHELIFDGDPSTNRGLTPKMKVDSPVKNPVTKNVPPIFSGISWVMRKQTCLES